MWKYEGCESFWEPVDQNKNEKIEQVLLSTYGFDPDFLLDELLTRLFGLTEPGTIDWLLSMCDELKNYRVIVITDAQEYATSPKNTNSRFQKYGGTVLRVKPRQHSKLWMVQTRIRDKIIIRIAIGSCNLTRDAFQNQIQYIWTDSLEVTSSQGDSTSSYLCNFIDQLTSNLDDFSTNIHSNIRHIFIAFKASLLKAKFPDNIRLLATVPFQSSNSIDYGLSACKLFHDWLKLRKSTSGYHLYVQVFSIGNIDNNWIDTFRESFHAESIRLLWPVKDGIVPFWEKMAASKESLEWIINSDSVYPLDFSGDVAAPERLPHGKLYALWDDRQERYKIILVGSSNYSRSAWEKNFELNVAIKLKDNEYYLDDLLYIDEDEKLEIDSLHFTSEQNEINKPCPWFILEAVQEADNNISITLDASIPVSNVQFTVLDRKGKILKQIKPTKNPEKWVDPKNTAQLVLADFKINAGDKVRREATIRKLVQDEISSVPGFQPNCEHLWILQKFGWSEEVRQRDYQTDWMAHSKAMFSVIDCWDRKSINRTEDADRLIRAFNWKEDESKSGNDSNYCWLVWEIAAQELEIRKNTNG